MRWSIFAAIAGRLAVDDKKGPAMAAGFLTTHVLDTARGVPAAGMTIELYRLAGGRDLLRSVATNADGRTDGPMLPADEFEVGNYELVFHAGAYLDAVGTPPETPRFLDEIPIRFGISDAGAHFHVPLLISPFGYSTYRGS
jgi:5-hydroxyisourate hydrolase